jgi:hypothetical protein
LHDEVERMQAEVKTAVEQPIGTKTRLFEDHGFLETADDLEVHPHRNSVAPGGEELGLHWNPHVKAPSPVSARPMSETDIVTALREAAELLRL